MKSMSDVMAESMAEMMRDMVSPRDKLLEVYTHNALVFLHSISRLMSWDTNSLNYAEMAQLGRREQRHYELEQLIRYRNYLAEVGSFIEQMEGGIAQKEIFENPYSGPIIYSLEDAIKTELDEVNLKIGERTTI